jgi:hypothetical protein
MQMGKNLHAKFVCDFTVSGESIIIESEGVDTVFRSKSKT